MERDSVAPMRKTKISVPAGPISRDLRHDLLKQSGNPGSSDLQGFSFLDIALEAADAQTE